MLTVVLLSCGSRTFDLCPSALIPMLTCLPPGVIYLVLYSSLVRIDLSFIIVQNSLLIFFNSRRSDESFRLCQSTKEPSQRPYIPRRVCPRSCRFHLALARRTEAKKGRRTIRQCIEGPSRFDDDPTSSCVFLMIKNRDTDCRL